MWNNEERLLFVKLLTVLNQTFDKNTELTNADFEIYSQALSVLDMQVFELAVNDLIRTRVYPGMPRPGEIVVAAKNLAAHVARERFHVLVVPAVRDSGAINSVVFSDPLIHCVIVDKWGSWQGLCSSLTCDTYAVAEKEFVEKYVSLYLKEDPTAIIPPLLGYVDNGNLGKLLIELPACAHEEQTPDMVLTASMLHYDIYGEISDAEITKMLLGKTVSDIPALGYSKNSGVRDDS